MMLTTMTAAPEISKTLGIERKRVRYTIKKCERNMKGGASGIQK